MRRRPARDEDFRLIDHAAPIRRTIFFGLVVVLSVAGIAAMTHALSGDGLRPIELVVIAIFGINFTWIALGFTTGIAGTILRLFRLDPARLRPSPRWPAARDIVLEGRSIILVPVHNEDPEPVFARIRAVWRSLAECGHSESFDVFVLSDTRDPDIWIEEELVWARTVTELAAEGRIFYRRRPDNRERKSGNLRDFLERWGGAYDFMIVFDADSLMSGETLVRLQRHMEASPRAGMIQTSPIPTGHGTLFARVLQFLSRLHGPTMARGLAFWQLGSGNYWGHNAIIRISAFVACCGLPELPGKPPLGGPILSHDFVEAALMRRGGWEVHLLPDLEGSWEELPPNVIDYAIRDRRWCQGNLQHIKVLPGTGLRPLSRLHLFMGVMSYLSSPFWLLLLLASTAAAIEAGMRGVDFFPEEAALFPAWPLDRRDEMLTLLLFTLGMLILPRLVSALIVILRNARPYGGRAALLVSMPLELLFGVLLAPVMMLLHSRFVIEILAGRAVGWEAQARGERIVTWREALALHRGHLAVGILWTGIAMFAAEGFLPWLLPVLAGLLLAPAFTHLTSRSDLGRQLGPVPLFLTPEEIDPPRELRLLEEECARSAAHRAEADGETTDGLRRLIEDPVASALHAALLPDAAPDPRTEAEIAILYEKLARLGADSLSRREKILLLSWPVRPLDQIMAGRSAPDLP